MWHAFDIIADELGLSPELRGTRAGGARKLVYGERVVRWFSDKSGKSQWPAVVDQRPGIVIERTHRSDSHADEWFLHVEHTRQQSVPVTMRASMTCTPSLWRSPRSWEVIQTIGDTESRSSLGEMTERGDWDGNQLTRRIHGKADRAIEHTYRTSRPASVYPLLADFPVHELHAGGLAGQTCDALFTESLQHMGAAAFTAGAPGNANEHPLAEGLTCYRLIPSLGFPLEFWINEHGVVVYLIEAATRAWVLQSVEALP